MYSRWRFSPELVPIATAVTAAVARKTANRHDSLKSCKQPNAWLP